jgi:hypothetical protein
MRRAGNTLATLLANGQLLVAAFIKNLTHLCPSAWKVKGFLQEQE